jgi:hypothetical protein
MDATNLVATESYRRMLLYSIFLMPLSIAGAKASPAAFVNTLWISRKKIALQPAASTIKAASG